MRAFAVLLVCQLAGEVLGRALALPVPGPVLGLVLLVVGLGWAARRGWISPAGIEATALGRTAGGLLAVLGILFVPAGVGIIQQFGLLGQYGLALLVALVVSTAVTLIVTVYVFLGVSRWLR